MRLTSEHLQLQQTVKSFIQKELNPHSDAWEEAGMFPMHEVIAKMGKLGLLGIDKPTEYGGLGLDFSYQAAAMEAMGHITSGGVGLAINVQLAMATPALARFGSDELRKEYLVPAIAGEQVAAIAVSEVGAGSDVAALKTTAIKDGDDYIINGHKMWITNGTQCDWYCLLANTSDGKPHSNKSLIIVPRKTKGVSHDKKLNKLGMRASDTAQIFFEDVRVPQRNRIGEEGMGFMMQMIQFQEERLSAISSVLSMEEAIKHTIDYCRERHTFCQPLIDNQYIHFRLAELMTEVEALRSLFYRAIDEYVGGNDVTMLASMAKLKTGRLSREVADTCLQYFGGNGFMWDNPLSRMYRDTRLISIGGGADEIMLGIICKLMNILPGKKKK